MTTDQITEINDTWYYINQIFSIYIDHKNLRLTRSTEVYPDLLAVQKELGKLLKQQNSENSPLTSILLLRVTMAGLKRMPLGMKIDSLKNFLLTFFRPRNAAPIINAIVMIIKYRFVKQ